MWPTRHSRQVRVCGGDCREHDADAGTAKVSRAVEVDVDAAGEIVGV